MQHALPPSRFAPLACRFAFLAVLALAAPLPRLGAAEDARQAAKTCLRASAEAVVIVRLTVKNSTSDSDDEHPVQALGVALAPSGLIVTSLNGAVGGFEPGFTVVHASAQSGDGTESDADVAIMDETLDLLVLRLRDPAGIHGGITLPAHAAALAPADAVFAVGRSNQSTGRTPTLAFGTVKGQVRGPQPYLLASGDLSEDVGCMAFAEDGSAVGLVVWKKPLESSDDEWTLIIRPCEQVGELLTQAAAPAAGRAPAPAVVP